MKTSIQPFIHRKIVILHAHSTARQAARAMCERQIGCVLVSDSRGQLLGIVTDRDLTCGALALSKEDSKDGNLSVSEIMTPEPAMIAEDATVEDALSLMEQFGIRRIPVVQSLTGDDRKCVGLITLDDLMASSLVDTARLAKIVQAQIWHYGMTHTKAKRVARAEARHEQTLNHFYKVISNRTKLTGDLLVQVTQFLLSSLVRRLHYMGASHFIAQLPHGIQEDMLDLPAGPDRSVEIPSMIERLKIRHGLTEPEAQHILESFFSALSELFDRGQIEHVKAQLPRDFSALFDSSPPRSELMSPGAGSPAA